jgi:hypothetical protein
VPAKSASLIIIGLTIMTIYGVGYISAHVIPSASAHFFGVPILQNKTVGNYKIVFQPYPTIPLAGDNSTQINLSVLDKDGNLFVVDRGNARMQVFSPVNGTS